MRPKVFKRLFFKFTVAGATTSLAPVRQRFSGGRSNQLSYAPKTIIYSSPHPRPLGHTGAIPLSAGCILVRVTQSFKNSFGLKLDVL